MCGRWSWSQLRLGRRREALLVGYVERDDPEVKSSRVWVSEGVVFFPFTPSDLCLNQIC